MHAQKQNAQIGVMIKIYQTIVDVGKGNCVQTAVASLLEIPLEDVPNFRTMKDGNSEMMMFIMNKGYDFLGSLYNEPPINTFQRLKDHNLKGIKGCFLAHVISPKYQNILNSSGNPTGHMVVIDNNYNIVNVVNEEYEGMVDFPKHEIVGYHGINTIWMFEEHV